MNIYTSWRDLLSRSYADPLWIGLVLVKFVLQYYLVHEVYELHRDEFLHLDQAHHLAWGYFSVPPFTSWVAWIIHALGNTEFWVRFFPALFGALTLVLVWEAAALLGGDRYARFLAGVCVLFSPLLRLNGLFQPNSFDVLAWTALFYFLIRYLQEGELRWLLASALAFALGFLNKYTILFPVAALFPALLLSGQRGIFLKKGFYLSVWLALLLILPNLIWQFKNGFPVVEHMALLKKYQLVHVSRIDFLQDQLYYCIAALPVFVAALYGLLVYPPFRPYRFLVLQMVFSLLLFAYFQAKSYYAMGLYPLYLAFGSVYLSHLLRQGRRRYLRPVLIGIPVVLMALIIPLEFPVKTPAAFVEFARTEPELGMHRWEDGKEYPLSQDFADMLGWKELAEKTAVAVAGLPSHEPVLILCDNYGQAGAINYYSKGNLRAHSFSADYLGWIDLTPQYRHLVRIKDAGNRQAELAETLPYFESGELADSLDNAFAREFRTDIFVFRNARISINERVAAEIRNSGWH